MTEASNFILFQSVSPQILGLSILPMSIKRAVFTVDSRIGFIFRAEAFKSNGSSSPTLSKVDENIELIRDFVTLVEVTDGETEDRSDIGDSQPGMSLKSIIG